VENLANLSENFPQKVALSTRARPQTVLRATLLTYPAFGLSSQRRSCAADSCPLGQSICRLREPASSSGRAPSGGSGKVGKRKRKSWPSLRLRSRAKCQQLCVVVCAVFCFSVCFLLAFLQPASVVGAPSHSLSPETVSGKQWAATHTRPWQQLRPLEAPLAGAHSRPNTMAAGPNGARLEKVLAATKFPSTSAPLGPSGNSSAATPRQLVSRSLWRLASGLLAAVCLSVCLFVCLALT